MEKTSWRALEYIHTEKNSDWYWIVGIVTLSIAIISIILNNVIFAILIIVSVGTLTLYASRRPTIIEVEINSKAIIIGRVKYNFEDLDSFWVEKEIGHPRLLIKSKRMLSPYISALIEDIDPENVRQALLPHLPEEQHTEPFLEKILIYLGF